MADERVSLTAIEARFTTVGGDVGYVKARERDALTRALRMAERELAKLERDRGSALLRGRRRAMHDLINFDPPVPSPLPVSTTGERQNGRNWLYEG